MPRQLLYRRYWERVRERERRRGAGVVESWAALQTIPPFIDYFPDVPATLPEKMVFQELVDRRINFYFAWYFGDLAVTPDYQERYRPDFYLPDYKVIIEVYGLYWHTREGQFEHDFQRAFFLTASGYTMRILTDQQVFENVHAAVGSIPEVANGTIHGNMHMVGDRPVDPRAAVRARLRGWPKVGAVRYRKPSKGGVAERWRGAARPTVPAKPIGPLLTELTPETIQEAYDWKRAWLKWRGEYKKYYGEWPPAYVGP